MIKIEPKEKFDMEDNSYLPDCSDNDVLSINDVLFKVGKFRQEVKNACAQEEAEALSNALMSCGVGVVNTTQSIDCEILRLGAKDWQKGKVEIRFSVEFFSEEPVVEKTPVSNAPEVRQPESPLDDIRRMMNENS
jgi:hypothetical protein